jgi:hypothetical protein
MRFPGSFLVRSELAWILGSVLVFGCTPDIGDSCKLHTDCSATGNRICEPNLPGGYCTIFNCEPGGCPSEAACVAFGVAPSAKPECAVTQQQRLERTYCMKRCSGDGDCRSGYSCVDLEPGSRDNIWNAAVIDHDRGTKVCTVKATSAADAATRSFLASASDQVCSPPPDASFPAAPRSPDSGATSITPDAMTPVDGALRPVLDGRAPLRDAGGVGPDAHDGR